MDAQTVMELLDVKESYKVPDKLMKIMFSKRERETLFMKFLEVTTDVSFDWFHEYFETEQADRKEKKQDFTPEAVAKIASSLVGNGNTYFESACGTGGMLITRWHDDCMKTNPIAYRPSIFFYQVEELSDAALPFLLFNCLIRGMNVVIVHGDSLSREVKNVYFVQNTKDSYTAFSSLNVMPRTETVKQEFNVSEWIGKPIEHIENEEMPKYLGGILNDKKQA
ncbi:N-6 DNA methylase [Liquorilactobacillus nagelii]|uniref:N-6 DNA methylase n=1 Tax=Liquorilactobacillus nagelii TaxID=82688 RepID=UPI0039E84B24